MLMTFDVVHGDRLINHTNYEVIKNAAVLYSDGLTIDRMCGFVVDIDENKLLADIFDSLQYILNPEDFVCSKWYVCRGLYHKDINKWGEPWALVLLERREVIENARKESEETRE